MTMHYTNRRILYFVLMCMHTCKLWVLCFIATVYVKFVLVCGYHCVIYKVFVMIADFRHKLAIPDVTDRGNLNCFQILLHYWMLASRAGVPPFRLWMLIVKRSGVNNVPFLPSGMVGPRNDEASGSSSLICTGC